MTEAEHTYENLFTGLITCNRMISSVNMTVTDENGQVFSITSSGIRATIKSFDLQKFLTENYEGHMVLRGDMDLTKLIPGNAYHCTVVVHMGSGESITVRDFDFVATDADISTPHPDSTEPTEPEDEEVEETTEYTGPLDFLP